MFANSQQRADYSSQTLPDLIKLMEEEPQGFSNKISLALDISKKIIAAERDDALLALDKVISWVGLQNSDQADSSVAEIVLNRIVESGDRELKAYIVKSLSALPPSSNDHPYRTAEANKLLLQFAENQEQVQAKLLNQLMSTNSQLHSSAVEDILDRVSNFRWHSRTSPEATMPINQATFLKPLIPGILNAFSHDYENSYKLLGINFPCSPMSNIFCIFSLIAEKDPRLAVQLLDSSFNPYLTISVKTRYEEHADNNALPEQMEAKLNLFNDRGKLSSKGEAALLILENCLKTKIPTLPTLLAENLILNLDSGEVGISNFALHALQGFDHNIADQVIPILLREASNIPDWITLSLVSTLSTCLGKGVISAICQNISEDTTTNYTNCLKILNSIAAVAAQVNNSNRVISAHRQEFLTPLFQEKMQLIRNYSEQVNNEELLRILKQLEMKVNAIADDNQA